MLTFGQNVLLQVRNGQKELFYMKSVEKYTIDLSSAFV